MFLTEVKLMIVKVRIISVVQVSTVLVFLLRRLFTPMKKDAENAFNKLISPSFCFFPCRCSRFISFSK